MASSHSSLVGRDAGSLTPEQWLQLVSDPFSGSFQQDTVKVALAYSFGLMVPLALLFAFVRPRHTLVYAPKTKYADEKHQPPPIGKGFFAFIKPVATAKESTLVGQLGLDAVIFLRFTRMLRNVFVILSIIGVGVMMPVNMLARTKVDGETVFSKMTPIFVTDQGLWAQVVCAWVFDIIVGYFLWRNYRAVHRLRREYLESPEYQRSMHARTLIIRDIPKSMRSDEGVAQLTDEVNPVGVIPKTLIGRNVRVLPDLIEEHEESVKKLETILSKYLQNPDRLPANRPTMRAPKRYKGQTVDGRVDAIEYLTNRIRELEEEIKEVRERVDKRDTMPYGFASWQQVEQAHIVAYAARKKTVKGATIRLAPRPNDLIWDNQHLSKSTRGRKRMVNYFWIAVLTVIWTPINAGIAIFLTKLSTLALVWNGFAVQFYGHIRFWTIVQGIASPAITSLVYLVLPIIFRRLQVRAGDATKTSREHHVLRNLYLFFILNNLLVFSLFSAVFQLVSYAIQSGDAWTFIRTSFFPLLMTALCKISPFWVTWILQRNLGAVVDIAQLWTLVYIWFCRTFLSPTPRQNIEWTKPPAFNYASYYNYFLFYSTVALCFSTLQPIILVVTAFYFTIDAFLKKYLLMYVFITKTESGGMFWRTLYNRLLFAVILSNAFVGVTVASRVTVTGIYQQNLSKVIAIAPLPFLTLGFKWYCSKKFDEDLHYYKRSGMTDPERPLSSGKPKHVTSIASKFGHPALYKPLMTPMVNAKAKHVLAQIYRGRLNSENIGQTGFSDIALEPMGEHGKPPEEIAPFEYVSDAQQDFAFFKNRSDFREEDGEVYGRQDDLISERSPTPKSFLGGPSNKDLYSPSSSRPSSPTVHDDHFGAGLHHPKAFEENLERGIHRKAFNEANVHPALLSGLSTREPSPARSEPEASDIGLRHVPGYVDGFDDTTNLLRGAVGPPVSTPGVRFIPTSAPHPDDADQGSYDYFRGQRRG